MQDLMVYFPDYSPDQKPERDYLIAVISTINPEATKEIISDAREKRSLQTVNNLDDLVKITPEFKELIQGTAPYKSNSSLLFILQIFILIWIDCLATRGIANYLMKSKAKLKRERKVPTQHDANLGLLRNAPRRSRERSALSQSFNNERTSMEEMEKEKKEEFMD